MKKLLSLVLCGVLLMSCCALAEDYYPHMSNEATFETLEEARENGPAWLSAETGRNYIADPALDTYPVGTTYVYRSPGIYTCMSAGTRMNTNLLVYADSKFESKEAAYAYIESMGLIELADKATGSVVLVTPIGNAYALADQYAYYQLQSVMCNIGFSRRGADGITTYYADAAYYGGLTYRYLIGIGSGATFINNFISTNLDYISRIAGLLLVNGTIERISNVAAAVPTYLAQADERVVEKYKAANGTDAFGFDGDVTFYFNQALPLQQVLVLNTEALDVAQVVRDAYYSLFVKTLRNASLKANQNSASTVYSNYKFNQAPYSLSARNYIEDGRTADGLVILEQHNDELLSAWKTESNGKYVRMWYEILPEEVLNHTAAPGTVPLLLANHGAGDDPIQFLDEMNWLNIAGKERLAIVAPYHTTAFGVNGYNILCDALPALVRYMLETYPELDASRVYVTGYSMGGGSTNRALCSAPELFAAGVPQAALTYLATEEQAAVFSNIDIPVLLTTSTYDSYIVNDAKINDSSANVLFDYQAVLNQYLTFNEIDAIDYDFDQYWIFGAKPDMYLETTLNGEYTNRMWMMKNDAGIPMVGLSVTDFLPHGLYQEYGSIAWNFMKHYRRNTETNAVEYSVLGW